MVLSFAPQCYLSEKWKTSEIYLVPDRPRSSLPLDLLLVLRWRSRFIFPLSSGQNSFVKNSLSLYSKEFSSCWHKNHGTCTSSLKIALQRFDQRILHGHSLRRLTAHSRGSRLDSLDYHPLTGMGASFKQFLFHMGIINISTDALLYRATPPLKFPCNPPRFSLDPCDSCSVSHVSCKRYLVSNTA